MKYVNFVENYESIFNYLVMLNKLMERKVGYYYWHFGIFELFDYF